MTFQNGSRIMAVLWAFIPGVLGAVCVWTPLWALGIEYAKVYDVTGAVKVIAGRGGSWTPLSENSLLPAGARVKTSDTGSAQVELSRDLTTVLKLSPNSCLRLEDYPPSRLHLEKGDLWIIRESDQEDGSLRGHVLQVGTRDLAVKIGRGGCVISVTREGTRVKVFQEAVEVSLAAGKGRQTSRLRTIHEGHQFFVDRSKARWRLDRLRYEDYSVWETWIRTWYDRKDQMAAEKLRRVVYAP